MDQEMDAALERGRAVSERSHDELAGREEVVVTVQWRGKAVPMIGRTFRAYLDDPEAIGALVADVSGEIARLQISGTD